MLGRICSFKFSKLETTFYSTYNTLLLVKCRHVACLRDVYGRALVGRGALRRKKSLTSIEHDL